MKIINKGYNNKNNSLVEYKYANSFKIRDSQKWRKIDFVTMTILHITTLFFVSIVILRFNNISKRDKRNEDMIFCFLN